MIYTTPIKENKFSESDDIKRNIENRIAENEKLVDSRKK